MIRLEIDEESLNRTRLTFSPVWEVIGSVAILARYPAGAPQPYTDWARAVRPRIGAGILEELVAWIRMARPGQGRPGVVPVPSATRVRFSEEVDHLRSVVSPAGVDPRVLDLLVEYWMRAVAPYWNSLRNSLEEEILLRGRTLAVGGPEAMLGELGGRVLWADRRLTAPYHEELHFSVSRSQLLLVPTAFAAGTRLLAREDGMVAISYQARARGVFHALTREPVSADRLAMLLGRRRAEIVRYLDRPRTTTAVAQAMGLAKSTVSQHLSVLVATGIAWKRREGGQVFYQLDDAGRSLTDSLALPEGVTWPR